MRSFISILAAIAVLATPVLSGQNTDGESGLQTLLTGDDSRGWEAVGRLNIAGKNMCTGALIAPDVVLTAAHCLFNKSDGTLVDATKIEFLAGWRNGRATAYADVKRAILHPDYTFGNEVGEIRVRNDVALLQLTRPIHKTSITPFKTDVRPRKGDEVGIVSYAFDRAESPALQKSCHILARQSGTLIMSCDVDYGSSGAPVFVMQDGVPRIVSVVSAKAEVGERKVALGTALEKPLAVLMARLEATQDALPQTVIPPVRRMTSAAPLDSTGAKFLRP